MKKELNPGSRYCDKCQGYGTLGYKQNFEDFTSVGGKIIRIPTTRDYIMCADCNGEGQFDWIEQAVGKKV